MLLEEGWKVTLLNRGRAYWGTRNPFTSFGKAVTWFKADRTKHGEFGEAVLRATAHLEDSEKWDLLLDFSLFHPKEVKGMLPIVNGRVHRYVFISSDSVYEVCPRALEKAKPVVEADAVRPKSATQVQRLKHEDSYGHRKLECEEVLALHSEVDQDVEIVSLRLADVLGPRDDTQRFYATWLWTNFLSGKEKSSYPLDNPMNKQELMFTFSEDVARYVRHLSTRTPVPGFRALNLCCPEPTTFTDFYELISGGEVHTKLGTETFLPSVNRKAPLSVELIRKEGFEPTGLRSCIQSAVEFCKEALVKHHEETLEAISMLPFGVRSAVCKSLKVTTPPSSSSESSSDCSS